jgi:hypothetical protein
MINGFPATDSNNRKIPIPPVSSPNKNLPAGDGRYYGASGLMDIGQSHPFHQRKNPYAKK